MSMFMQSIALHCSARVHRPCRAKSSRVPFSLMRTYEATSKLAFCFFPYAYSYMYIVAFPNEQATGASPFLPLNVVEGILYDV